MVIELTDIAPTGEAVGRNEGLVIFTPFGLPGEKTEIEIIQRRKSYARAQLMRVLNASPVRVLPRCKYFGRCGGCEWQHADYNEQLEYKTRNVHAQLKRIGRFTAPDVRHCLPSPRPYIYRNHTQFVLSDHGRPGYYMSGSRSVVEVDECPIIDESLNQLLPFVGGLPAATPYTRLLASRYVRSYLRELHLRVGVNTGERMMVLELNHASISPEDLSSEFDPSQLKQLDGILSVSVTAEDGSYIILTGQERIHERVGDHVYAISPATFFQVNTHVAELLVREVLSALQLQGTENVLDLYCGAGLFTVPISWRAKYVIGIESSTQATNDALLNLSGRNNARIISTVVGDALAHADISDQPWDAIVLDPPRTGVDHRAIERVIAQKAPRLVYVSCDPATLARDARTFCDNGYILGCIQPLDMFPQTHHVEIVATFNISPTL